jgi:DNA-binding MarR family transcriptional regulator
MLLFKSQTVREQYDINWHEELVLGAVASLKETWTSDVIDAVGETMSANTAHKYVTQLIDKGFLEQTRSKKDRRFTNVKLSKKAVDYLFDIQEAAWTKDR